MRSVPRDSNQLPNHQDLSHLLCVLGKDVHSQKDRPPRSPDEFWLRAGSRSAQGPYRKENQDRCYCDTTHGLFVIADGMGGYDGGVAAARIALNEMVEQLLPLATRGETQVEAYLSAVREGAASAHWSMLLQASENPMLMKMGSTLAWTCIVGESLFYGRLGDCRLYVIRDGQIQALLSDQTMAQEMVDRGFMSAADAESSRWKHCVTNCIGASNPEMDLDVHQCPLLSGDRIVLMTDGVSGVLDDRIIRDVVMAHGRPQSAADALVVQALRRDSHDNASCIVVKAFHYH